MKFDETDISTFEAFSIFCGIGIHNTKMYESAYKLMAKQAIVLIDGNLNAIVEFSQIDSDRFQVQHQLANKKKVEQSNDSDIDD